MITRKYCPGCHKKLIRPKWDTSGSIKCCSKCGACFERQEFKKDLIKDIHKCITDLRDIDLSIQRLIEDIEINTTIKLVDILVELNDFSSEIKEVSKIFSNLYK